ncbi:MAG TPA: helix-turn-helix domain-containing protein [Acidimicrobiia bacterium]|nr:helix-turn-helix domain-containing protein [Acidimicrobiia bacterium]
MRIHTAADLAAVARGRRLDVGWTQAETAGRAGVSRKWLSDFETGKATVDLAAVLRLLDVLEVALDAGAGPAPTNRPGGGGGGPVDLDDHLDRYLRP